MNHFVNQDEQLATFADANPAQHSSPENRNRSPTDAAPLRDRRHESSLSTRLTFRLFRQSIAKLGNVPVRIVLPDGQEISAAHEDPVGTIKIHDRQTLLALALDPLFQFGEAYADGKIEIQGDMADCLTDIYRSMKHGKPPSLGQQILYWLRRPSGNSINGSKHNVHHHYDLGNDFYRLWLDKNMLYTCAYFRQPDFTLEQAQLAKMNHVCRKLQLKPGMRVVEAGCGWGALAMHMAKHYGVRVRAYNISAEQIGWARQQAKRQGLANQLEFVQDDWRNIEGQYDAFVSVGMLEHVGVKNYRQLGQTIRNSLKPDGIGLIHTIGQNQPLPFNSWIERRIFPGAYVPTLKQMMELFEPEDFQILDVENLRLHYAETLRRWLERFEGSREIVQQEFDERFVRMWRMYLAGSVAAFESGCLQLYQVVFANGATNNVPRTREHLYRPSERSRPIPKPNSRVGL